MRLLRKEAIELAGGGPFQTLPCFAHRGIDPEALSLSGPIHAAVALLLGCAHENGKSKCLWWDKWRDIFFGDDDPPSLTDQVREEQDLRIRHKNEKQIGAVALPARALR